MGSFPNRGVDATPVPSFGAASSAIPDQGTPRSTEDQGAPPPAGARPQDVPQDVPIAQRARPWRPGPPYPRRGAGPDPAALAADRMHIRHAFILTLGVLVLVWGVFLVNLQFNLGLNRFGNRPLHTSGLVGILSMPFLHGGWEHLWGNTVSFFTLSLMLAYFYRGTGHKVLMWSWVGSGILLWLSGAPGNHIGLSGVVYAIAAFLFLSGIVRKDATLLRVALAVAFLYGSIVWGVFPIEVGVSWQGHLAGACTGAFLSLVLLREGPQYAPLTAAMEDPESAVLPDGPVSEPTRLSYAAMNAPLEAQPTASDRPFWRPRPIARIAVPPHHRGIRKRRKGPHVKAVNYRSRF